jgi:hypothetical protein
MADEQAEELDFGSEIPEHDVLRALEEKYREQMRQIVVDPIFWTEKRPFLRWSAALKIEESQCQKPARVTRPA